MNILFASAYFYRLDPKQWKAQQPYPPLGTLIAAAATRMKGHAVRLFDAGLSSGPPDLEPQVTSFRPGTVVIYDDGFNYLTKMCLTVMREAALQMIRLSKELQDCPIIVCSSDANDHYPLYLEAGADSVIRGEGEETLLELLDRIVAKEDFSAVAGTASKRNGSVIVNPSRPVMKDLDALPLPAWDLANIEAYRAIWKKRWGYFSMNATTTRGCPFHCNWCAKPIYGNRYTSRSPASVADEIERLMRLCQPDHIWFCDDIFGLKPGWVQQFREEVNRRNLKFRFKIQSRADLLLQNDSLAALAESGAETVWMGAESGSQKVLDAMDKGITVDQIGRATRLLQKQGIRVGFFLQFGYPGEDKKDIDKTIRMVMDLMPDEVGVSVSYPLPGTPFYDRVRSELKSKRNWRDSDDLAMMFRNTYRPAFYKALHRYMHSRFAIERARAAMLRGFRDPIRVVLMRAASMLYHVPMAVTGHLQLRLLML